MTHSSTWSWWPLLWASALILACQDRPSTDPFRQFDQEPCPLFEDDFLTGSGLPRCPIVADKNTPRPCAIQHFIQGDPSPRSTRRLAYDAQGNLTDFSDHRGPDVTDARLLLREMDSPESDGFSVHHFAKRCDEPVPEHLYSLTFSTDHDGRLSAVSSSTGHRVQLRYSYQSHWLEHSASVFVKQGSLAPRELVLDPQGNVTAIREQGGLATHALDKRNGLVHNVSWSDELEREFEDAHYIYAGRLLQEIRLQSDSGHDQRYRFIYQCEEGPVCADQFEADLETLSPYSPSAMSRDPTLERFRAHNCSDQLSHGPHLCGTVLHGQGPVSGRCCASHPDRIQLEVKHPLAGPHVVSIVLIADKTEIESASCRGSSKYVICDFDREAIEPLPATGLGSVILKTVVGQAVEQLPISLPSLARSIQ